MSIENPLYRWPLPVIALLTASCAEERPDPGHYGLKASTEIIVTSEAGDRLAAGANVPFADGKASGTVIEIYPERRKQTLVGIGSSFTESSAFVLAHLEPDARAAVMQRIYGKDGANFSLARTTIGSTDFSVEGKYSYAPVAGDAELQQFSIGVDSDGFPRSRYPGIADESFDLLPMIKEALAIKHAQQDKDLRIVSSAWTAPPWMKDIEDYFQRANWEIGMDGTGGVLKDEYERTYADYLVRYLDAYAAEGVDIWGLTPVNEPHGNSGNWESMHFTPETQNEFIKNHLGPALHAGGHEDVRLLIYDQNRNDLEHWTDVILADPETAPYVYGTAVHWYASTYKVYEDTLERVRAKFPQFEIIHTEGTIDDLGKPAPGGITDPEGFTETGWFDNDAFWWNQTATDWAYTATWAPNVEDHPMYTPVHRYARNIIVSLDHGMAGWIDWNVVLDRNGGPNHAGNFCGAPIMIDTDSGQVYYTPVFYVLAQLSRTIRPGDTAVQTERRLDGLDDDALHASAAVNDDGLLTVQLLNTTRESLRFSLQIGPQYAEVEMPANAVQTVRVQLTQH
ncbi:MAG: glycosyl hydrolase [Gammaproteobacteria bacterium]|nr:glycosyl hydrolase [Gammaproteobacteria bacterium]MBT8094935.1 glycosyl hydrolase [Gammaproteobacteria bacterium]NNF48249.1 glycoside hydrolase family 30 protein [Woeseiaceae bacterium]NNL63716.1 glycoside hydrolase family 30 protein [Woeseiaceae bacterium]